MKKILTFLLLCCTLPALAQVDKGEVRAGNRKFRKDRFKEAEIDYRKAVLKDSLSLTAEYNLASALYRQQDYAGAAKALAAVKEQEALPAQYHYNAGDAALQQQDYQAAVDAFRQALLLDPADLDAKENYIYAKKMLENRQNGGGGGGGDNQQNQDQNQDQNQNQDQQDQNQDQQDQDQNQDQQDQNQDQQPQISPQQAQQMLRAIQAKERETQDKVNREKAALLKSQQKEKNW
ncbi:MAG: tetratricopeptide repeat protein [Bacteroidales bacterium]|nr:tetratricopeptide repeat protein [Bacteroidales bacterium]